MSPRLCNELFVRGIGVCGTVDTKRTGMPLEFKGNKGLSKEDPPLFKKCGNTLACQWQDTKKVTMLSTVSTNGVSNKQVG